jgi:hypothetical protein
MRSVFAGIAWLLAACIAVQTLLAGAAVFLDPAYWRSHVLFVRALEWLPLLMLILAFPGKFAAAVKWRAAALFGFVILQYVTANIPGIGLLHPVIALFMFMLAWRTAVTAMQP